jgi:hemin uptake protein HemP
MGEAQENPNDTAVYRARETKTLTSRELFRQGNTVRIEHAGQIYWLRLTRGNKLILTK